ncbi:MAG: hypothetical protein NT051_00750 [Candidatus Micrarchaeota archaeon]|nr:hypothetical protein [Candidatus Micrarchaeota archaeon]
MNATKTLNPAYIKPHPNGKFTQPELFYLIKSGADVPSNTLFDPVIMNKQFFSRLPKPTRAALAKNLFATSTALFKPERSYKFGEKLTGSYGICSVTLIVPKAFATLAYMGIAIDLTMNNFEIAKYDGKNITIEITEKDAKLLELFSRFTWSKANESTLWMPAKEVLDGAPFKKRFFSVPDCAIACLVSRGKDFLHEYWDISVVDYPVGALINTEAAKAKAL